MALHSASKRKILHFNIILIWFLKDGHVKFNEICSQNDNKLIVLTLIAVKNRDDIVRKENECRSVT